MAEGVPKQNSSEQQADTPSRKGSWGTADRKGPWGSKDRKGSGKVFTFSSQEATEQAPNNPTDPDSVADQETITTNTDPETQIEAVTGPKEIPLEIAGAFETALGIDHTVLEGTAGFANLSREKQLLILRNLKQMTLDRAEAGSIEDFRKGLADARGLKRYGLKLTKAWQLHKRKKALTEAALAEPTSTTESLQALTEMAAEGPDVSQKENGEMNHPVASRRGITGGAWPRAAT
ncbi:hypothetical protein KC727_01260 [Candidatus Kaiserbacteria bacterium]|nr:hypothetical protein [Candidatus Kaiserbacteria bacterium]